MDEKPIAPIPPPVTSENPTIHFQISIWIWILAAVMLVLLPIIVLSVWWSVGGFDAALSSSPDNPRSYRTFDSDVSPRDFAEIVPINESFDVEREYPAQYIEEERYYSNEANIAFDIPNGWKEVQVNDVTLQPGVKDPVFLFLDGTGQCAFAGATFARDAADYKQTSFGDVSLGEVDYFNGQWFTDQSYHENPIQFSKHTRQYLKREIFVMFHSETVDILLWNPTGGSVSNQCFGDFSELVQSMEYHFQHKTLESYDTGVISIERVRMVGAEDEYLLVFIDTRTGNTFKLTELPSGVNGNRLFVKNGELHFFANSPESQSWQNPLDAYYVYNFEHERLLRYRDVVNWESPVVSSWYVVDDLMYYLTTGTSSWRCIDGPSRDCELDLRTFPIDNPNQKTLLLADIPPTHIMGYVKDVEELYLYTGYGDAGCVGAQLYVYKDGQINNPPPIGGCAHMFDNENQDEDYLSYISEMETLDTRIGVKSATALRYSYGTFTLDQEADAYSGVWFVLVE